MTNEFLIDTAMVINSNAWPINRQIATRLSLVGSFSVGSFFQEISDEDLRYISEQIANPEMDDDSAAELFLLMSLLAQAEGAALTDETMGQSFDALNVFVTITMLHRQNLVEVSFDNMSFDPQMRTSDVVVANEQGLKLILDLLGENDAM